MAVTVGTPCGQFRSAWRTSIVVVPDTSARLLRLLSLLQSRPDWSGPELAERLGVTTRTVRRDVDRLRQLGYPVDAAPGVAGGYRLGSGADLPPLLLDDDEATAVADRPAAPRPAAPVRGIEEPALAALAKLDRLLPPHLRQRVAALRAATVGARRTGDAVDVGPARHARPGLRGPGAAPHAPTSTARAREPSGGSTRYRLVSHRPSLVPRRPRRRPRRLADVPRRPHGRGASAPVTASASSTRPTPRSS